MIIYSKSIETEDFKKLTALLTKCKISEDIINNVIGGNIQIKNKEAYDRIYADLIKDTIVFEEELDNVKESIIGENLLINGLYFHVFSSRSKLIATIDDSVSDNNKNDIGSFLIKRGFEKSEIK